VDKTRLGITGYSAGGVVSLIVAGTDARVKASVPLSGTHAWAEATKSPTAWQHELLTKAGYTIASPEWIELQEKIIDPAATVAHAKANVFMANGSTDEFFPLSAHVATYAAIPTEKRTSISANFDHGCYGVTGIENKANIEARADARGKGAQRLWFHHWFGTNADYAYVPATPSVQASAVGGATAIVATIDKGSTTQRVEKVTFWWSIDDAWSFAGVDLDRQSDTAYQKLVPGNLPPNAVYYLDVEYSVGILRTDRFSISSVPVIPAGHVPKIRGISSCQ